MEPNMFCYQCQETAKGTGCILKGVCGKESHTAQAMDLLLFVVRGVSVVADVLRKADCPVSEEVNIFVTDALFCTITIWSMSYVWDSMMIRFMFSCNAHWLPLRLSLYRQRSG